MSDTGVGIEPDFLPHVFERFSQGDSSITRTHGGLGLGLAIVRHLVELHGGTVEARRARVRARERTFSVTLPLMTQRCAGRRGGRVGGASRPRALATRALKDLRVLVVDDDPRRAKPSPRCSSKGAT